MAEFSDTQKIIVDMSGKVSKLESHMIHIDEKLGNITEMMGKIIAIEQHQAAHSQTFERVFKAIDDAKAEFIDFRNDLEVSERKLLTLNTRISTERNIIGIIWGALSVILFGVLFWLAGEFIDIRDRVNRHDQIVIDFLQQKINKP